MIAIYQALGIRDDVFSEICMTHLMRRFPLKSRIDFVKVKSSIEAFSVRRFRPQRLFRLRREISNGVTDAFGPQSTLGFLNLKNRLEDHRKR
jgi:hypothetical protein